MVQIINRYEIRIGNIGNFLLDMLPEVFEELDLRNAFGKKVDFLSRLSHSCDRLFIIGFGKASYSMYAGIRPYLAVQPVVSDIIVPELMELPAEFPELKILRGTHPDTGHESEESTRVLIEDLGTLRIGDLVLVLISGGGSALFELPEDNFTIEEISEIAKCMMAAGADIFEMNAVRAVVSKVKGGKFARILFPATVHSFIVSDVIGDDIGVIASGPLSPVSWESTFVKKTVRKFSDICGFDPTRLLPGSVTAIDKKFFSAVNNEIILRNSDFVDAFYKKLKGAGAEVVVMGNGVSGKVEEIASSLSEICRSLYSMKHRGFWFVFGGETTVVVRGQGSGGRNQELALRFALKMGKEEKFTIMTIGTDGIDGKSPAMGAILDNNSISLEKIDNAINALDSSDSYTFLNSNGSAIITGFTGTNVSDIIVGYYERS
ncbi:MAG: DUF4147 domain-containing protein [Thermoplasmataceae archaeon]